MARYTAWMTVIDGVEKKHRSENATYTWLRDQAGELPDGTKVSVFVQEEGRKDHWYTFERLVVLDGRTVEVRA